MFYYVTIVYHNQCKKQSEIFIGKLKDHVVSVRSTGKFAKERNFCFPGRNVPFMFLILFVLEKGNHPISIILLFRFSPSIFCHLAGIIPCAWILEFHLLDARKNGTLTDKVRNYKFLSLFPLFLFRCIKPDGYK